MPLSLKVHHFEKIPGSQNSRLTQVTPYLRLSRGQEPPVYVQGGQVWSEGGADPLEQLPDWFGEEVAKASPAALKEVGWGVKEPVTVPVPATPQKPTLALPTVWTCPECNEQMSSRKKGVHVARHRKAERKGG